MRLEIPEGTEGLLFNIKSIVDGILIDVMVEGEPTTTLRVSDGYWASGYVPIGEAPQTLTPANEPVWTEGRYFPHFPSTDKVYAIRVRTPLERQQGVGSPWSPEWRINDSHETMMALTLVGMQGLINRNGPRVYIDWNDKFGVSPFWIPHLGEHIEVVYLDLDGLSAVNFLMRRYASRFAGAVIYDPEVPDTINLATMLAGLEDRIMLAPEQLGLPGIPNFDSVTDLRPLAVEHGWDTMEEGKTRLYQWAYDNLWPRLEHRIIGVLSPGPPTSGDTNLGNEPVSSLWYPMEMATRDYVVALRLSALWLDPRDVSQEELFGRFLEDAPSPIPVLGPSPDEESSVALASRHGDWVAAITWPGPTLSVGGLTVLSGVRPELKQYQQELDTDRILATLGEGPVAMMWTSDGDAMFFQMDRGFWDWFIWEDVQNQRYGWAINPTLAELAPLVWNYYVESRSGVSLVAGFSGGGYVYPQLMDDAQLQAYVDYTARYLEETGLRVVHVAEATGPFDQRLAVQYYEGLRGTGYVGAIAAGFASDQWALRVDYIGAPSPTLGYNYVLNGTSMPSILADLLAVRPGFIDLATSPQFLNVPLQGLVLQDGDAYREVAVFVPRDFINDPACCGVVAVFAGNSAPGDYTVTFRLKVPDNQASEQVARLYVIAAASGQILANRRIAPADFQQAGQYQDFTLSFTLDQLTSDSEFRIDYEETSDLYADSIEVTREGGVALPVFAALFMGLTISPELFEAMTDVAGRFTEGFESAGGLVLHPDEFMAALNPEFMIGLAEEMMGPEHPALAEARQQLADGTFLASLLTTREALREFLSLPASE